MTKEELLQVKSIVRKSWPVDNSPEVTKTMQWINDEYWCYPQWGSETIQHILDELDETFGGKDE